MSGWLAAGAVAAFLGTWCLAFRAGAQWAMLRIREYAPNGETAEIDHAIDAVYAEYGVRP